MNTTIQFKTGNKVNLPTLNTGELGFCVDTYELYVGNDSTNVQVSGLEEIEIQAYLGIIPSDGGTF